MKHVAAAIGIAVLAYVGYIAIAPTPIDTLNRVCSPFFIWPKKFLASGAKIFLPKAVDDINESFDAGFARCRAWGWGVLYEDEYQELVREQEEREKKKDDGNGGNGKNNKKDKKDKKKRED